ncbi:hypothetical protein WOLCODRAFT_132104 [Wolfiporia cocos MD-104 SS10]|uniref:C2H2-type domain-containing protein n=1 Tax=Wolfiporia cocos (strain MD-104) TaxID=742152 RepID=A0A2H3JYE6_WOLCO|nr:hypothetical protein WOLCODRAFT_132104 [Wolfiporia cocos MD-104 SS10]
MSSRVSLPSINELFPEHLWDTAPAARASVPEQVYSYPSTSTRILIPQRISGPSSPSQARSPAHPSPASDGPHSPHARTLRDPPPPGCSFDVLRPNPLTADLENVASSTSVADPPRIPGAGAFACAPASPGSPIASITKSRPAFRVQLPAPRAPDAGPAPIAYDEAAAQPRRAALPPSFSANAYLSTPTTPGSAQSLSRLAAQAHSDAAVPGSEEKRHCCPHCNKRFNRPSSLNIHVNTHTGAKPFVCRFPGCNRKFNVNSNMRRHYRNHLTSSRRRDAVARMLQPASDSPSDSDSHSPPHSPDAPHSPGFAYRSAGAYSAYAAAYDAPAPLYARRRSAPDVKLEFAEPHVSVVVPESSVRTDCRLRSHSQPMPPPSYGAERARARSPPCADPRCQCGAPAPISTTLRPAFPECMPRGESPRR